MKHVVIIGGGFSGTLTAVNLARLASTPLRVTVVNAGGPRGRGIAYGTGRPEHLLNVAARNMSAFPDQPNHFLDWLRTRTEYANVPDAELRETFMPRRVYGDYVGSLALHHAQSLDGRTPVETRFLDDEVRDLEPTGAGARVVLARGEPLMADQVVLATGNETPAELPGAAALGTHPGYAANPWSHWEARLPDSNGRIVLLGTGLTAVDAVLTLLALDWRGEIIAVSRHGWLPQSHFRATSHPEFPPADTDVAQLGLERLAALVELHCARLRAAGENPAIVVDRLRPHTQRIWQAWSAAERRTFLQEHAARWNVLRHRIAPSIHQAVTQAQTVGHLKVRAGSISRLEAHGTRVRVLPEPAGRDEAPPPPLDADLVINCTGPQTRFSRTGSPLLRRLLERGLVQPDEMDMGVRIGAGFTAIQRDGQPSPFLHALGPLLRGTFWETIAVPELRGQALQVAQALLGSSARRTGPAGAMEAEAVLEYHI